MSQLALRPGAAVLAVGVTNDTRSPQQRPTALHTRTLVQEPLLDVQKPQHSTQLNTQTGRQAHSMARNTQQVSAALLCDHTTFAGSFDIGSTASRQRHTGAITDAVPTRRLSDEKLHNATMPHPNIVQIDEWHEASHPTRWAAAKQEHAKRTAQHKK